MPDEIPTYYTNSIRIHANPFDVTIDFGHQLRGNVPPVYTARVTMGWEEAEVVRRFLTAALEDYEEKVGPVRELAGKPTMQPDSGA